MTTYRIGNSSSDLRTQNNISLTNQEFTKSIEKLASGKRINKASDDPSSVVIAERLKSQISGTEQAIRNTELDITLLQTGESAMGEISTILHRAKQVAIQAGNEAVNDQATQSVLQQEYDDLMDALDTIVRSTKFGDKKVIGGDLSVSGLTSSSQVQFIKGGNDMASTGPEGVELVIEQNATRAFWAADDSIPDRDIEAGIEFKLIESGKTASYITKEFDSPDNIIQALQDQIKIGGLDLTVGLENERMYVYHNKFGSGHTFSVYSNEDGYLSDEADEANSGIPGLDAQGYINGVRLNGKRPIFIRTVQLRTQWINIEVYW